MLVAQAVASRRTPRRIVGSQYARFAARFAFWLAFGLLDRGETARGTGWLRRAHKLVDHEPECAERGGGAV